MKNGRIPLVSIGLPVYNGERYLAETIDSLLVQTLEDFELIISDNASTDGTQGICDFYRSKDPRIRYSRNETNVGASMNFRRAFELSSGEYFRWANSDDLFAPESLRRCVEVLDREPSVVLTYPKTTFIDGNGEVIGEYDDRLHLQSPKASERFMSLFQRLGRVNVIYGLIRAGVLSRTRLIPHFVGGDVVLVAELSLYGTFWEIPEFLFYRRLHSGASSSSRDISMVQEFFDPKTKGRPVLRELKHLSGHIGSIKRAPLALPEKIRLYRFLIQAAIWHRRDLWNELTEALRFPTYFTRLRHII